MEPLTAEEARILGCLIEKERTTPEYYPLTINALVAACNQKTNRHPVVEHDEATVERTLHSLDARGLIGLTRASGGRATKYVHRAGDLYEIDDDQLAVLAVLLLRGPQTPGELRSRTERYFAENQPLDAVDVILNDLMGRAEPLVERLSREPGQKEHRFRTLVTRSTTPDPDAAEFRPIDSVEDRLATVERKLDLLATNLGIDLDETVEPGREDG
jgi:hypothetical protein